MIYSDCNPWFAAGLAEHSWVMLGGGGHARVVLTALSSTGVEIMGYLAPSRAAEIDFTPSYLGDDEWLLLKNADSIFLINGVGAGPNFQTRRDLFKRYRNIGFRFPPILHPQSLIANRAKIGESVQVMMGATVQDGVTLGENVVVNTGAIVEHDVEIGSHAFVGPGAIICGGAKIEASSFLGAGCTILPGLTVGAGALVAAGAVVTRSVAAGENVAGCPAQSIKRKR